MKKITLIFCLILSSLFLLSCKESTIIYQAKCGQQNISGAKIFVDGTDIGYSTPAKMKLNLSNGAHYFRMVHPEYGEWSDELHISPGQREFYVTGYFEDKYAWAYGGTVKVYYYSENRLIQTFNMSYLKRASKSGKMEYRLEKTSEKDSEADYMIIKGSYFVGGDHYNAMQSGSVPSKGLGIFMNVSW